MVAELVIPRSSVLARSEPPLVLYLMSLLMADDYLTDDEDGDGQVQHSSKRGSSMGAGSGMNSLSDTGRASSSSSLSSKADRDTMAYRGADGGIPGRGPPVAPQCDYVVDKILGRKVFLVQVMVFSVIIRAEGFRSETIFWYLVACTRIRPCIPIDLCSPSWKAP